MLEKNERNEHRTEGNWGHFRDLLSVSESINHASLSLSDSVPLARYQTFTSAAAGTSPRLPRTDISIFSQIQIFFRPMQIKVEWRPRLFSFETSRSVHSAKVWFCVRLERQLPAHTVRRFIYLFRRCEHRYTDRDSSDMFTQTERWARCTRVLCNQKENTQRVFYLTQVVRWFQK